MVPVKISAVVLKDSTVVPLKASTVSPLKLNTLTSVTVSTVIPLKVSTVVPLKASTVVPLKLSTLTNVMVSTVDPLKVSTVVPVKRNSTEDTDLASSTVKYLMFPFTKGHLCKVERIICPQMEISVRSRQLYYTVCLEGIQHVGTYTRYIYLSFSLLSSPYNFNTNLVSLMCIFHLYS